MPKRLCLSLLLVFGTLIANAQEAGDVLVPLGESTRLRAEITAGAMNVSGLMVVRRVDGEWRGSVVNEFGVRAFDFTLSADRRKVRVLNAIGPLRRRMVRRTLQNDLAFLFGARGEAEKKGTRTAEKAGNAYRLTNARRGITYVFSEISEANEMAQ